MSYPFASGKIRVLEKRLLSQNDLDLMVNSKNAQDCFAVLNDTDLADNLLKSDAQNFGSALAQDFAQNRKLIEEIVDDKRLIKVLFLKYDFHNLKVFLKSKISNSFDFAKMISRLGTINPDELKKRIIENSAKIKFGEDFESALAGIERKLALNNSPAAVDEACDKEYFVLLAKLAGQIGSKFISDFCRLQASIVDLKVDLRRKFLIKAGKAEIQKAAADFIKLRLKPADKKFFENYFREGEFWQLEKAIDDLLVNRLRKTKFITYGPEVVFAYVFSKYNSAGNMRLSLAGKCNEIETEEIKKRVRKIL